MRYYFVDCEAYKEAFVRATENKLLDSIINATTSQFGIWEYTSMLQLIIWNYSPRENRNLYGGLTVV